MSKREKLGPASLRAFVTGAAEVASIQECILNAMAQIFPASDIPALETALLAPGYENWESRAIKLIKSQVKEDHDDLNAFISVVNRRYSKTIGRPGQTEEYWVDPVTQPHLRIYFCLKCGYEMTSLALKGICCHGQPPCLRCKHEVHEANCRRARPAEAA